MSQFGPVTLGGKYDSRSFLLRGFEFSKARAARKFFEGDNFGAIVQQDEAYEPILRGGKRSWVVTEPFTRSDYSITTMWSETKSHARSGFGSFVFRDIPETWVTLQPRSFPKPPGARNTALLLEGVRRLRGGTGSPNRPGWWSSAVGGPRQVFTVWGDVEHGDELPTKVQIAENLRCYMARSGRGLIYYDEVDFDSQARVIGNRVTLGLLEFHILDKHHPEKDASMRVRFARINHFTTPREWELDDVWRKLLAEARDGFDRFCKPVVDEVETQRVAFLEQMEKERTDGERFRRSLNGLSWHEALDLVHEAYQLRTLVKKFCASNRGIDFDRDSRLGSTFTRVCTMLLEYECTEERRRELQAMVAFSACQDRLWYTMGD